MFNKCIIFNQPLNNWERKEDKRRDIESSSLCNVLNMDCMFGGCTSFNQDISLWDVSKVTNMSYMFHGTPYDKVYEKFKSYDKVYKKFKGAF